jgi:hypothetical protein
MSQAMLRTWCETPMTIDQRLALGREAALGRLSFCLSAENQQGPKRVENYL